ncbi:MAG: TonB-dependent receptor [Algicola sp.]|nr:TonB-dependent receptor [Algicola sp.]
MKHLILTLFLSFGIATFAQQTGSIVGKLTDKEASGEPLSFANILIKGTIKGTTSDYDGLYALNDLEPGTYTLIFSFVGYETQEIEVLVEPGKVTNINVPLGANAAALDEIVITTTTRKDSEVALLLEQKKAVSLETSIGAEELSRKGASDAAAAVTKISGIVKEESSGNVFVRGLGDRYNMTSLNGLPIPSNNTSKKNINLELFDTEIIESIGVDKTYNAINYGDFGGANINILSKNYTGKGFAQVDIKSGVNTAAIGADDFYTTDGPNFTGFYNEEIPNSPFTNDFSTSFDRSRAGTPLNSAIALKGGDSYDVGEDSKFSFFVVGSFDNGYSYREGINNGAPNLNSGLPNSEYNFDKFSYKTATTLMGNLGFNMDDHSKLKYNFLMLNNSEQKLEEFNGILDREDDAPEGGGFIRRSTFERTTLMIHQLLGDHELSDRLDVNWAIGYNDMTNLVPDRRQNTLLPYNNNQPNGPKSFRLVSAASANHRFFQELTEDELVANIATSFKFSKNEEEEFNGKITLGYNGRFKNVNFESTQFNYQFLNPNSQPFVDPYNIDAYFNEYNTTSGYYQIRTFRGTASLAGALDPQTYGGEQLIHAGFATLQYKLTPKFTVFAGFRVEQIAQNIDWNTVIQGIGENDLDTFEWLPSLALKYELNEKNNLRFAASKTYTLPQFKERAPFLFQEEINQDSFGNQYLTNSENYNVDLRWEFFPTKNEIISLGVFGKQINNAINKYLVVSAANNLSYANTGDATAFGAELEVRKNILQLEKTVNETSLESRLSGGLNVSYLNTNQDLDSKKVNEETGYSAAFTNTEAALEGASDLILNADLSYYTELAPDKNLRATVVGNYFSDRIYALGSTGRGHLVDQGYISLDFIAKAALSKHFSLGLTVNNILNPLIERTNENAEGDLDTNNPAISAFLEKGPITTLSYKKGTNASLTLSYKF